jgi:hypothetical protein
MMARQKGGAPAEPVGRVSPPAICACRNSMRRWRALSHPHLNTDPITGASLTPHLLRR